MVDPYNLFRAPLGQNKIFVISLGGLVNTLTADDEISRHILEFSYVIKILNVDPLTVGFGQNG